MFALCAFASSALYQCHEEKAFINWMRETNNMFTGNEYSARLGIWMTNQRYVTEHNAANGDFALVMNKFAHLSPSEYKSMLGLKMPNQKIDAVPSNYEANDAVDWRKNGIVNAIKDQSDHCGSCWAFSTIQAQESQWAKITGTLYSLSEQNLVDCVTTCDGCRGGFYTYAYDYIIKSQAGKFMLESDYPYLAVKGNCKFNEAKAVTKVTGYISVVSGSENDLAAKVSQYGPACIAIDASHNSFQLYGGGVYIEKSCSTQSLDHAVGCVGYGTEGVNDFWIVRNSWGSDWGESGYVRMLRNKKNQCGVATVGIVPKDQ